MADGGVMDRERLLKVGERLFSKDGFEVVPCYRCNGTGILYGPTLKLSGWCADCKGKGHTPKTKDVVKGDSNAKQ